MSVNILEQVECADSRMVLRTVYGRFVRSLGYTAYAVGRFPLSEDAAALDDDFEPFLLLDWPEAWLQLYAREGFVREDAAVARAKLHPESFTWGELQADDPSASARIFKAAATFGWNDGFVVPVHRMAPLRRAVGVVVLASSDRGGPPAAVRTELVGASLAAYGRAVELSNGERAAVVLTPRETAVLSLVAEGLNDAEIAKSLRVSSATASFHVENAKRRLNASTRAQAVALALRLGLIQR